MEKELVGVQEQIGEISRACAESAHHRTKGKEVITMAEKKQLPMAEKKQSGCGCGCIAPPQKDAKAVKPAAEKPKK